MRQRLVTAILIVCFMVLFGGLTFAQERSPGLLAAGLAAGAAQATPPPIMLNPEGVISFDSIDHDKAVSYRVGWFRTLEQGEPDVSETILMTAVTTNATGPKYTMQARTRPPFRKYVLKIKLAAIDTACDADLGPCESSWSEVATWTKDGQSGMWLGYTPRNATGVVLH
jgi:hypothetical protein